MSAIRDDNHISHAERTHRPHKRETSVDINELSRRQFLWLTATSACMVGASVLYVMHRHAEAANVPAAPDNSGARHVDASKYAPEPFGDYEPAYVVDRNAWNLVLVNRDHPVTDRDVNLQWFGDGQAVDARCYPALERLLDATAKAGFSPVVFSSFRTMEYQQELLDSSIADLRAQGRTEEQARWEASRYIAQPGCSEHEVGLAVDVTSSDCVDSYQTAHPKIYDWLNEHSWEYGWIRRYPEDKESITGIAYEPWHFRYVGEEAAREIYARGIVLEEYLAGGA